MRNVPIPTSLQNNALRGSVSFAALAMGCLLPSLAAAQLATSPQPAPPAAAATVPEVTVTVPATSGQATRTTREVKAPAAAQQSSTPRRATQKLAAPKADAPESTNTADAQPAAVDPATLTVAPTGTTQSIDKIASSVTVVTSQEIDAQQRRTAPDLLRSVPGLNVVQSGGPGALTSVFTRGTNSNHTKVLIDGIDVSDPSSANRTFDFGQLTAFDLDRVEVLRGPQSGLYGADALGGVVVVYSKKGEGPLKMDALVEGGSFGTLNEAVSARGSTDRFNYAFNVSHLQADSTPVTPVRILGDGIPRLNNSYDNWTYSTKLGLDVTRDLTVNFVARYTDAQYKFQGSPFDATRSSSAVSQLFTRSELVWRAFDGQVTSTFGFNRADFSTDNIDNTGFASLNEGARAKYDWRSVIAVTKGVTVTVGADTQTERILVPAFVAQESNTGEFAQLELEPIHNLFLVGNVRHDDNDNFGTSNTWRFASAYIFDATATKIKGSVGTAFKAPSLAQRFQDFAPFFFANRNLKAEESTGYDVGFEQPIFNKRAQFGATYFNNDITNLIDSDPTFTTVINVGRAKTSGVEAFASADLTDQIRVRGDYTYTKAMDALTGFDLLRRPRNKATVSIGYTPITPLLLTGSVTYVGERFDVDRVTFESPIRQSGVTLVNIAADYKVTDNVSVFGRIDNLFDKRYENPNGYEGTGLGAYVGLRLRN